MVKKEHKKCPSCCKKITDEDLLNQMIKNMETDYYTFGAYSDYNGLDVKNIKHPFFENNNCKK